MGGINCGGGGGGNVSLEFSTEYIEQLASYCKSLFDGSAKFFEANVAIEDAVMTGGDLVTVMQLLSSSEDALTSARATLGTVAALWSSVRTGVRTCEPRGRIAITKLGLGGGIFAQPKHKTHGYLCLKL